MKLLAVDSLHPNFLISLLSAINKNGLKLISPLSFTTIYLVVKQACFISQECDFLRYTSFEIDK